jgi:hypothetical protein
VRKETSDVGKNNSGRNERFRDNRTGETMSRAELVRQIEAGNYPNYHVREINNVKTPVSNPDSSEANNLD